MGISRSMSKITTTLGHASRYIFPAETSRHIATILGFPSRHSLAPAYYDNACKEVGGLAAAISAFEPVRLYARPEDTARAQSIVNNSKGIAGPSGNISNVTIIPFNTNHLWVRDTGPVYVRGTGAAARDRFAVNFRFNEWGGKIDGDGSGSDGLDWPVMDPGLLRENAEFARCVIDGDVSPSPVGRVESRVRLEGGALVVDGEGTLLATESSILNENRNPGLSRDAVESELWRLLGVEKIIWFPGRKGLDITDVHIDAEVAFVRPGVVVLSRPHRSVSGPWREVYGEILEILQQEVDARGRRFEIHLMDEPDPATLGSPREEPATNYVNFHFVNGGLVVPQFGDPQADRNALDILGRLCPGRVLQPVHVRALPLAGGAVHCATQPVIAVDD